jgi:plastocyanin
MRKLKILLLVLASFAVSTTARAVDRNVSVGPGSTFSPSTLNINVGDRVIWTRLGGLHNVQADDGSFGNVPSDTWNTFMVTFNSAGSFEYFCDIHSSATGTAMNGVINVAGGGGGSAGTLQFSTASTSVNENAGTRTINVTRTGGDDGAVSVQYETVDGSATFPSDYTQTNNTLGWGDNDDDNKTFVVPIVNDSIEEPNQSFTIRLQNPTGGATLGNNDVITVTINDDDEEPSGGAGTIRFTSSTATVSEGAANVTLTAERVNGSSGAVSVSFVTANGSASSGSDYTATTTPISWANGDSANKTVQVPIVADTIEETNETFTATLSSPTGGASIGSPSTATVTITDDDVTCEPCVADDTTLCLAAGSGNPNRFRVRVNWTDFEGDTGAGRATPLTADSGFFYFFNSNNLEILAKMVRGCGTQFDAYWFFGAAASNVQLEYEVVDTEACVTKVYTNPLGRFASFGDINALATCP